MNKERWFYAAALMSGLLVWIAVSAAAGRREAWDSTWYFSVGIPFLCLVSMLLGFLAPDRSWRWGVAPFAGQFLWMLLTQGPGNLLPQGVVMFGVLSVPSIFTARAGAFFARKYGQPMNPDQH